MQCRGRRNASERTCSFEEGLLGETKEKGVPYNFFERDDDKWAAGQE